MRNSASRPKEILVAFIEIDLYWRVLHRARLCKIAADERRQKLAEKPKVEELQTDWLRSEDLKEEKDVTASRTIIAGEDLLHSGSPGRVMSCSERKWNLPRPRTRDMG